MLKWLPVGIIAAASCFLSVPAAQAVDIKGRCLNPIVKDVDFDACVVTLADETLKIQYKNKKKTQFNRSIPVEKITNFSSETIYSQGVFLGGSPRVLITVIYQSEDNKNQVETFIFKQLRAVIFENHLGTLLKAKKTDNAAATEPQMSQ